MMKTTLTQFATDYPPAKFGCKYTEFTGSPGLEYPVKEDCGPQYYVLHPFVYVPLLVFGIVAIALIFTKNKKKKSK